jgi:hypothetical protein
LEEGAEGIQSTLEHSFSRQAINNKSKDNMNITRRGVVDPAVMGRKETSFDYSSQHPWTAVDIACYPFQALVKTERSNVTRFIWC